MVRKVGLDEVKEDDLDSTGEELMTEDLKDLEKQQRQLEEEVEAGQQPTAPQMEMTIKILQRFHGLLHQTMDYMENTDPDFERSGLKRRQVMEIMAYYEDLLSGRRRKAMQSTLDCFFKKKKSSLPEASATNEPQPGSSTGGYTRSNVLLSLPLPSPSPVPSTPASFNSPPPPPTPSLSLIKQRLQTTLSECHFFFLSVSLPPPLFLPSLSNSHTLLL